MAVFQLSNLTFFHSIFSPWKPLGKWRGSWVKTVFKSFDYQCYRNTNSGYNPIGPKIGKKHLYLARIGVYVTSKSSFFTARALFWKHIKSIRFPRSCVIKENLQQSVCKIERRRRTGKKCRAPASMFKYDKNLPELERQFSYFFAILLASKKETIILNPWPWHGKGRQRKKMRGDGNGREGFPHLFFYYTLNTQKRRGKEKDYLSLSRSGFKWVLQVLKQKTRIWNVERI